MTFPVPPISVGKRRLVLSRWDALAVLLVLGVLVFLAQTSQGLLAPLASLQTKPLSLDPFQLPGYAARTTLRMLTALGLSLLFTFTYATVAAKSRRAELLLLPLLDILQSVPILGFISVTVVFFMSLVPGRVLGAELAAVFAIFTSQAWNMTFSFYQSLRTVPVELLEASRTFRFSPWMRFWRVEVPFAMPQLIWNMMMSMSGGWFFVVASEAISVGETTVTLPGIGSYIALAIEREDLAAVGWAISTMLVVILLYDQLLFRPLVAWADRFRFEQEAGVIAPKSWVLDVLRHSGIVAALARALSFLWRRSYRIGLRDGTGHPRSRSIKIIRASVMGRWVSSPRVMVAAPGSCFRPWSACDPPHHAIRNGSASQSRDAWFSRVSEATPGSPASPIPRPGDGTSVEQDRPPCSEIYSLSAAHAAAISLPKRKLVPSSHMRCRTLASLRASATFARFMPRRPATAIAQRFRLENRPARVSITLAAS